MAEKISQHVPLEPLPLLRGDLPRADRSPDSSRSNSRSSPAPPARTGPEPRRCCVLIGVTSGLRRLTPSSHRGLARNLQAPGRIIGTESRSRGGAVCDGPGWAALPPASDPAPAEWLDGASCGPHVKAPAVRPASLSSPPGGGMACWPSTRTRRRGLSCTSRKDGRRDRSRGQGSGRPGAGQGGDRGSHPATDRWWTYPTATFTVLLAFIAYATYAAIANRDYYAAPYISPFYSPRLSFHCGTVPGSAGAAPSAAGTGEVPRTVTVTASGPGGTRRLPPPPSASTPLPRPPTTGTAASCPTCSATSPRAERAGPAPVTCPCPRPPLS